MPPIFTGKNSLDPFTWRRSDMHQVLDSLVAWHNEHRPHMALGGRTPDEVYFGSFPANRKPRIEPRPAWPSGSPCARPYALVAGKPGARFDVEVARLDCRPELPIIRLRRAG